MSKVLSGLSERNKIFSSLAGVFTVTSGVDFPRYIDSVTGRSGLLGFSDWSSNAQKPVGVADDNAGSLEATKYFSIRLVPVDERRSYVDHFKEGQPTAYSIPIQASGTNPEIDFTIPIHPQLGVDKAGAHDGADNASVLSDSTANFGATDVLVGSTVQNLTDGSEGTITANSTTTITCSGGLSGGTDNDWDADDEYHVVSFECTARKVFVSKGDSSASASAGPFYFQTTIDNNTDTTFTLLSYTATTDIVDTDRLAPPATPLYNLSAFNRCWMFGGVRENTGKAFITGSTDDDGTLTYTVSISTYDYDAVSPADQVGQIMRYTLDSGVFTVLAVGSYVTLSGGTMNTANHLTDARIIAVGSNYFEVALEGVVDTTVTAVSVFNSNTVQGYTSGLNATLFTDGMVGAQFFFEGDGVSNSIAWVDTATQTLGLNALYTGRVAIDTATDYVIDTDTELFWSITNDPHVFPLSNVLVVEGRGTAIAQIGSYILIFTETSIYRMLAEAPEQGLILVSDAIGCKAPLSVLATPRGILFFDGVSLNLTDGNNIQSLTVNRADELLERVNRDYEYNIRSLYLHEKDMAYMVFPVDSAVNDWGLTVNLSNGDVYPERRNDVNAIWQEPNAEGQQAVYHGSTSRFTNSGNSYIYEHDQDVSTDDLPADSDFSGEVVGLAGQVLDVMIDGLGLELGTASLPPYLLEGMSLYVRSITGAFDSYMVISSVAEKALASDGNALFRNTTDDGETLFVGVDNLNTTGLGLEDNPEYTLDQYIGRKIYNITDASEGFIKTHDNKTFTVWIAEGYAEEDNATLLTDAGLERYIGSADLSGRTIENLTDCSSGVIVTNTATTILVTLSGGTNNAWEEGDEWAIKGLFGGTDNTWDGGSASALGDEYQIGRKYEVTVPSDFDLSTIGYTDRAYFCVIPALYGWKWQDFGSPHLLHKVRRLVIDVEPTDGNWITVEMAKDGIPSISRICDAWVDRNQTKAVFEFEMGGCYSFGYRIKAMGKNPLRIQNITIEQEPIV